MPKAKKKCAIPDCEGGLIIKGLCSKHYQRLRNTGTTDKTSKRAEPGEPLKWIKENVDYKGDDCIVWPFERIWNGYGAIKHEGKRTIASRLMCIMAHGEPPRERMDAAHSCGNGMQGCMNPNHLRWDNRKGNIADSINSGARSMHYKLSEDDVRKIISLKGQATQSKIASIYGVARQTIGDIHSGRRWGWIKDDATQ